MWALGYADPTLSVEEMEEPQNLIQPYKLGKIQGSRDNEISKRLSNSRSLSMRRQYTKFEERTQ